MKQISFYQIENTPLEKTVTQVIEKCHHGGFRCTILTSGLEFQEHLNKHLWTYSQKQFIPHGSKSDPLPERQPIYITTELENPNSSTVLVLAGCIPAVIESVLSQTKGSEDYNFERIIVIFDINDSGLTSQINTIKECLSNSGVKFDYYKQSNNGWVREP